MSKKKKATEEAVVESENQIAEEIAEPVVPVDPFDALVQAVKDSAPARRVDPETGFVAGHAKPADDHGAARAALEKHVLEATETLGPDHPEVERKRRLMNMAFR